MAHTPTLEELERDPRPVTGEEAQRILGLDGNLFAALDLPVTKVERGVEIYDSEDVVHWLRVQRNDPQGFAARLAAFGSRSELPPH